jgi:eukaryotic-like serine/threonine-protein kinase
VALSPGTRIGAYEIVSPLGAGGMGEVYRALDTALGRHIAIKILPATFANDPDRLARFEREAKTLAALNHPHIAQIYGFEKSAGVNALVMELVEGATLADCIAQGAIPVDEALAIAKQIAEALEAAHEQGIIHRDLKPANIKVRDDGTAKVLDFGLAKALDPRSQQGDATVSPTITSPAMMTGVGVLLGTAAYMSPEQARGQTAGHQADIWAFGIVLYEMLTGKQAFTGETITDVLGGIVRVDPDWTALPESTPPLVLQLLRQCLQKNRPARLHHIGDARIQIDAALSEPSPVTPTASRRMTMRRRAVAWTGTALLLLIGSAAALFVQQYMRAEPSTVGVVQLSVSPPQKATFSGGPNAPYVSISPDGRHLAFIANREGVGQIFVRPLATLEARPLTGTEGVANYPPFWSPDSRFIAFFAAGKLKKIEVAGGPAQTLCDAPATNNPSGTWNRDGVILLGGGNEPVKRVSAAGGTPEPVTTLDRSREELGHDWPTFLPDGDHFFFLARSANRENDAIVIGSLSSKETTRVVNASSRIAYDPSGYLLFVRERSLMALPFDGRNLSPAGDPLLVADQIRSNATGQASLTVSDNGVLGYRTGDVERNTLTWFDRSGRMLGVLGSIGGYSAPELSPDERRVAVFRIDSQTQSQDVWVIDVARTVMSRLTFGLGPANPLWSPDGARIAFRPTQSDGSVYAKQSSGVGEQEMLFKAAGAIQDWSSDGKFIISSERSSISVLPLVGDRKPFPYLPDATFTRGHAQLSSDGRWMAYRSSESGRNEVYIQSFPTPSMKWQISTEGGDSPRWRRDGKEIFYLAPDQRLMAVSLTATTQGMEISRPVPLFQIAVTPALRAQYDVTGDGQRFLVNSIADDSETPVTVVVNWTAGLKK